MKFELHSLGSRDWAKTIGVGIGVSALTAAFMVAGLKSGVSPLPRPLGLAFAEAILERQLPLPVGLLFHTVWVTAFTALYVVLFRDALTFVHAFWLGVALWVLVLVFFFPIVGWGFLGLGVSPKLIVGSAVPHLLFAVFLWALCRWAFSGSTVVGPGKTGSASARGR
jgi:ABC-type Na+ efflux pump permease subunit